MTHHRTPEHPRALVAWIRLALATIAALAGFVLVAYAIHGAFLWTD